MPAEIESFFYLARNTSASEKPAFFSKQLSSRGAACRHGKGRETPRREGKALARLPSRPSPLFADKKTNLPREIRFRRTAAIAPPRSSPAFYRILRRLEIASARAALRRLPQALPVRAPALLRPKGRSLRIEARMKIPSGPITETEASFAPKSEDS